VGVKIEGEFVDGEKRKSQEVKERRGKYTPTEGSENKAKIV